MLKIYNFPKNKRIFECFDFLYMAFGLIYLFGNLDFLKADNLIVKQLTVTMIFQEKEYQSPFYSDDNSNLYSF